MQSQSPPHVRLGDFHMENMNITIELIQQIADALQKGLKLILRAGLHLRSNRLQAVFARLSNGLLKLQCSISTETVDVYNHTIITQPHMRLYQKVHFLLCFCHEITSDLCECQVFHKNLLAIENNVERSQKAISVPYHKSKAQFQGD